MSQINTVESWLQIGLQLLIRDDSSPASFSTGSIDGIPDRTPQRRQLAVDMIYRCVKSGLMRIGAPRYRNDTDAFIHVLQTSDPYSREDGMTLWHGGDLCPTEALIDLIGRYFPKTGPLEPTVNAAFIGELKDIFAEHGVPWSASPLLPIVTTDNSASA